LEPLFTQCLVGLFYELHLEVVAGNQRRAVEDVCVTNKERVWVAEVDGTAVGFVAVEIYDPERSMGEISMMAVDPDHQGSGIGTALSKFALDRLRDAGMKVAMVEKGGEPGHAAARRTYERAGYVLLPIARYFKNLWQMVDL
jgi:GNAT superfamily N-acetyltransferase